MYQKNYFNQSFIIDHYSLACVSVYFLHLSNNVYHILRYMLRICSFYYFPHTLTSLNFYLSLVLTPYVVYIPNISQCVAEPWYQYLRHNDFSARDEICFYFRTNKKLWKLVIRKQVAWDESDSD